MDGFRADYLLRNVTPTVARLSQCGVRAPYMRSVYPTKTFPNHYTIVTVTRLTYTFNLWKRYLTTLFVV